MDIFSLISSAGFPDGDKDHAELLRMRKSVSQSPSKPRSTLVQAPPRSINIVEKDVALSTSPVQQRLARARMKRQQILIERVQLINNKCTEKEHMANMRHMNCTFSKVSKARMVEKLIIQAKSKREQLLEDRVTQIGVKLKLKESGASNRKEGVTLQRVERARTELAKSPIAKRRREQQLLLRVKRVDATLQSRTARAQERFEMHLLEKQQRACWIERKERAELRRGLISYEKRARLLATLDAKLEGATVRNHRYKEEKTMKAGEDFVKAKEVARRVKAAREIQCFVRSAFGMKLLSNCNCGTSSDLSQHDAAQRLQKWSQWKLHVCKTRFFGVSNEAVHPTPEAFKALENIVSMFPLVPDKKEPHRRSLQPPPFESLTQIMMTSEALKMATLIVECTRSISGDSSISDGRTLLAICLIAIHPREVLGDDLMTEDGNNECDIRGSRMLALSSQSLLAALHQLVQATSDAERILILKRFSSLCRRSRTLFDWWKDMDKRNLLAGLSTQLEQSWVVYLNSSESLRYLAQVSGVDEIENGNAKTNDPLLSLRLRLEASKSGSCSHIKRIRLSLNKLIGKEEGKEFVTKTKLMAQQYIEETNAGRDLKDEIDEIHRGLAPSATTNAEPVNTSAAVQSRLMDVVDLPDEIISNRKLVHMILLTEPCDFGHLSWDGTDAQLLNATPEEFIVSIAQPSPLNEESNIMSTRIAQSMRIAFFRQITTDLEQKNFGPVHNLLHELHAKMRSLLPTRSDLHSHIDDTDVSQLTSASDLIQALIRSGLLLATYLESPFRAPSTIELIDCLQAFNSRSRNPNGHHPIIPYGIKSEELLVVTSIAYILHKADLCQVDVCNHKLHQAAPLVQLVGHDFERDHFVKMHGDYHSSTIAELQQMLPSTWNWVQNMQTLINDSSDLTTYPSFDQNIEIVKGIGFVDGLLFTKSQTSIPEILALDVESIHHIRTEAQCCVIASALALHACNISRVGASVLSSTTFSSGVVVARRVLSRVLRETHYEQNQLECAVVEAVRNLTQALAERDLTEDEFDTLRNHALAVIHWNDPVLKLLDNRVQSFFRFACKYQSNSTTASRVGIVPEMRTGVYADKMMMSAEVLPMNGSMKSTTGDFQLAASKEASRLGFAFVGSDLVTAAGQARGIISLACTNYGQDILDRLLCAARRRDVSM